KHSEEEKQASSKRMKENNPMWKDGSKEKMIKSLRGKTFLARGGNGQPTKQQLALCEAMNLPMEYVIETAEVMGLFPSLPPCYKVDLAEPSVKLAIEVDGKTHRLKKWKFLDHRKTEVLTSLGWQVLRFSNKEVDENLSLCVETAMSIISKLKTITTIS
ncbi:MAG: DUF559 domain-containing protein, partial [Acidobacteria bacterium]|nr:DUF559 domain-containing protein [Acidobacteriota bacterium]